MARNKHNTCPYKKHSLVSRFHLPTRIMTSSRLNSSSLLRPHSPVPSLPLTPAPKPKEDRILFLPRLPYTIINNPHFHHPKATMAHNKHNTRPYKKHGLIPRFHLPTRIMTSSRLNPSSLLHPLSPVPSPPLTPAPKPKEDHILFLP